MYVRSERLLSRRSGAVCGDTFIVIEASGRLFVKKRRIRKRKRALYVRGERLLSRRNGAVCGDTFVVIEASGRLFMKMRRRGSENALCTFAASVCFRGEAVRFAVTHS